MRNNQPITQRAFELDSNATLMSVTDPSGTVTYANDDFLSVAGFSREEVVGQPHNVVRHPDMPPEAFADMWATLRDGLPWTGLVKNRRKDGDHYWVRANAVPIIRRGETVGYLSVRTRPEPSEVSQAEALHADLRAGRHGGRRLYRGTIQRTGWAGWLDRARHLGVRMRIRAALGVVLVIAVVATLAAMGTSMSSLAMLAAIVPALILADAWLEQQIARPLEDLQRQALDVATGASREVSTSDRLDEIGVTTRSVAQAGLMFRWLVEDVSRQVMSVQHAIDEIAQGNADLSQRTERAAASVQETASSMNLMTEAVRQNTQAAGHARTQASSASEAARQGGDAVTQVIETMRAIRDSSQRIADILGVIDGIAFQTNILALNAAVEAARAGEQGRGFAVVAGEVRALAQRSADAAKEIKALIGESTGKVSDGSRLVGEAGAVMDNILASVQQVADLIEAIRAQSAEQTDEISQVNTAVAHLDDITQQNASLVEQSAAASHNLRQQAHRLVEAVRVFH